MRRGSTVREIFNVVKRRNQHHNFVETLNELYSKYKSVMVNGHVQKFIQYIL